ncbi:MAG: HEAT repeat domain-containing protein [bacterium]|nr:HEAT repeat domain-containing protein [bacterium]
MDTRTLGELKDRMNDIEALIDDDSLLVKKSIAIVLAKVGLSLDGRVEKVLFEALELEVNLENKKELISVLGNIETALVIEYLAEELLDGSVLSQEAGGALIKIGKKDCLGVEMKITELLKDKDLLQTVKVRLLKILTRVKIYISYSLLQEFLGVDENVEIKKMAILALGNISTDRVKEIFPKFLEALKDNRIDVRCSLATALGNILKTLKKEMDTFGIYDSLKSLLYDCSIDVRKSAVDALQEVGSGEAIELLAERLRILEAGQD